VEAIMSIITRHPMDQETLERTLALWSPEQVRDVLADLADGGEAQCVKRYGMRFWCAGPARFPDDSHSLASAPGRRHPRQRPGADRDAQEFRTKNKDKDMAERVLNGKRIGVFGKGGCGKSTVTVLLARALKSKGYDVCLLDADSTNVGLWQALGAARDPTPLLEFYGGMVFSGGFVTCPVDDPTPLAGAHILVELLPESYHETTPDGIHLFVAGKMGDKGPGAGCDGPIAKIARDFRPEFAEERPVTLVDYKAGFEDSARGNIISLDWIIVVVDPTTAAIQMAIHMRDMVEQLKAGGLPATAHLEDPLLVTLVNQLYRDARVEGVLFILNRVRDKETEQYICDKLGAQGIKPIGTFQDDPALSMAWLKGMPLVQAARRAEAGRMVGALEEAAESVIDKAVAV
jgi:CO dehydrogenase maturation factor